MEENTRDIIVKILAGIFLLTIIMIGIAIKVSKGSIIPTVVNSWENSQLILALITTTLLIIAVLLYRSGTKTTTVQKRTA